MEKQFLHTTLTHLLRDIKLSELTQTQGTNHICLLNRAVMMILFGESISFSLILSCLSCFSLSFPSSLSKAFSLSLFSLSSFESLWSYNSFKVHLKSSNLDTYFTFSYWNRIKKIFRSKIKIPMKRPFAWITLNRIRSLKCGKLRGKQLKPHRNEI